MTDSTFALGGNSQVPLSVVASDANGNLVTGDTPVFTSSDESVVTLKTEIDGSMTAVRVTASAGTATVTATITNADGVSASGSLVVSLDSQVPVVADVVNVEIVPGVAS